MKDEQRERERIILASVEKTMAEFIKDSVRDPNYIDYHFSTTGFSVIKEALALGMSKESAWSCADTAVDRVRQLVREVRRQSTKGATPKRVVRRGKIIDIEFEGGGKQGVPPKVKQEMGDMALAGCTARDISEEYGYPEPDVRRILKSMKIRAPEPPSVSAPAIVPPEDPAALPEVGFTGIDAATELLAAEALMAGVPVEHVASSTGLSPAQVEAVQKAWNDASPTEAAADAIERRLEAAARPSIKQKDKPDPITEGEILFYAGAGPDGWRVEIPPPLASRLEKRFDWLRRIQVYKAVTEYDRVRSVIVGFADRVLASSSKFLKGFAWGDHQILEFKGWQSRVFYGVMKSVYPGGREVWRIGLVWCILKKRDELTNAELRKIVEGLETWRAWRSAQDEKIVEGMSR